MDYYFSKKSKERLKTCHPLLQKLFNEVIKHRDISILCGYRDKDAQDTAYDKQYTKVKWPNSKHNTNPSRAVDVSPYPINWEDIDRWIEFGGFVRGIAAKMGINVKWGGDFNSFFDAPHFELGDED